MKTVRYKVVSDSDISEESISELALPTIFKNELSVSNIKSLQNEFLNSRNLNYDSTLKDTQKAFETTPLTPKEVHYFSVKLIDN